MTRTSRLQLRLDGGRRLGGGASGNLGGAAGEALRAAAFALLWAVAVGGFLVAVEAVSTGAPDRARGLAAPPAACASSVSLPCERSGC